MPNFVICSDDAKVLTKWAWENMLYGGSIRWQVECRQGVILVYDRAASNLGQPIRIVSPERWSADMMPV